MNKKKEYTPLLDYENVLPILNEISILAGMDNKQLYKILRVLQEVSYREGEFIFETGEQPSHIYIIRKGKVKLMLDTGKFKIEKAEFTQGACFGESSVIGIQPHLADVIAMEDTDLIVLPRQALLNFYEDDPSLFGILILNIARELSRRLHYTEDILLHYVGITSET